MALKFIPTNRDQQILFPPSIMDWLPEKHLARFVVDIVSQRDLRPLAEAYIGKGFRAYHPEIILSLPFYGYAAGVFSSRKLVNISRQVASPEEKSIVRLSKKFKYELSCALGVARSLKLSSRLSRALASMNGLPNIEKAE